MFDKLEQSLFGGLGAEESAGLIMGAEVGQFGQKMEVVFVLASKEEEEGVDGLPIQRTIIDRLLGENGDHHIVVSVEQKIACVGHGDPMAESGGHHLLTIEQEIDQHIRIEIEIGSHLFHGLLDDLFLGLTGNITYNLSSIDRAIKAELHIAGCGFIWLLVKIQFLTEHPILNLSTTKTILSIDSISWDLSL